MSNIYKVLSLTLSYPELEFHEQIADIQSFLQEDTLCNNAQKIQVSKLLSDIGSLDIYAAQERYVDLFDRSNARSLHLFEHIHGESRDRGQAMVDLLKMYHDQGFDIEASELPDYLPLFLEFLSLQTTEEARALLQRILHIVSALHERLKNRDSIYANAFNILESLAENVADQQLVGEILQFPDDEPDDLEALDRVWEEAAVTFGEQDGANNACSAEHLRTQLRAAKRSATA